MKNRTSENGNVLFYILIVIALLASLSFAVSQSNQSGQGISDERAKLYAGEIIEYTNNISNAVGQLRLRGCANSEISFENNIVAGYENPNAPADETCNIFSINGGAITYQDTNENWNASLSTAPNLYGELYFSSGQCLNGAGQGNDICDQAEYKDLIVFVPYIKKEICIALNDFLSIENPSQSPPVENGNAWRSTETKFTGGYDGGSVQLQRDAVLSGCFEGGGGSTSPPTGTYAFYKTLIVN